MNKWQDASKGEIETRKGSLCLVIREFCNATTPLIRLEAAFTISDFAQTSSGLVIGNSIREAINAKVA